MRSVIRIFALVGLLFTLSIVLAIAVVGYVLIDGGTSAPDCGHGPVDGFEGAAKSLIFDAKLTAFMAAGARSPVESVAFDEAETSARAARYFAERTDRVSDVLVCFGGGEAEGFMLVETVFGRKVGVRGAGTLDLGGSHPRVELGKASIAGVRLPGFLRRRIAGAVNDQLTAIELGYPLSLRFESGRAVLSAAR